MQVELLEVNCRHGAELEVWPGFSGRAGLGFKFVKIFRTCMQNFYNIKSNYFFLSWLTFVVLTAVTSVSEVIVIFLQLILLANTAAFFSSLLGLVSHSFWEGDSSEQISTRCCCVEKINHSRDSSLVLRAYKPAFHVYSAIPESLLYACRAMVDSFVIVSFFSRNIIFRSIIVD